MVKTNRSKIKQADRKDYLHLTLDEKLKSGFKIAAGCR